MCTIMLNENIGKLHSAPCVATVGPGSRQNSGSFALHRDADTDIISLGHSGFRGENIVSKTWSSISFFLLQAAALALMGHFKSSLLKRPLVRSCSRDQSPSEFWNKVIFLASYWYWSIWTDINLYTQFLYPQRISRVREKSSSLNNLMHLSR